MLINCGTFLDTDFKTRRNATLVVLKPILIQDCHSSATILQSSPGLAALLILVVLDVVKFWVSSDLMWTVPELWGGPTEGEKWKSSTCVHVHQLCYCWLVWKTKANSPSQYNFWYWCNSHTNRIWIPDCNTHREHLSKHTHLILWESEAPIIFNRYLIHTSSD